MAKLIVRYPNNVIKEVEFNQARYRIGRADDNDLVLENDEVEPYHAEIETAGGAYTLVDVSESKNVTVNGKNVERVPITYGDRISLGPVVALFYPSKKEKVTDRTKLALYIAAGAGVIVVSIALIFFFTSRQISSVVSGQVSLTDVKPGEEATLQTPESSSVETVPEPGVDARSLRQERRLEEKTVSKQKEGESGGISLFKRNRSVLKLPEPDKKSIAERRAIAVPRGLRRLFFRRIPVPVPLPAPTGVEKAPVQTEGEVTPEGGELGAGETALPPEAKKGLFSRIISPIGKLFGGGNTTGAFEEEPEAAVQPTETPAATEAPSAEIPREAPVEGTSGAREEPARPSKEDIRRIVDPLAFIRSIDVSQMRESFSERPVYSENEMKEIEKESPFANVQVSTAVSNNIDILWQYPQLPQKSAAVIRTGALGRIDDDRSPDVVFGNKNNELIALSGLNGDDIFNHQFEKPFFEPLLVDIDGDRLPEIILAFEDGSLRAFSRNLEEIWRYSGTQKITSLPAAADITGDGIPDFIFETLDMEVVAVDGKTGFEIWRFYDAEGELIYSPVAVDINDDSTPDIVFTSVDGSLFAVDGKTGWGLWKKNITGRPAGPPAVGDLNGDGNVDLVSITKNGILSAYGKKGNPLFTLETGASYENGVSIGDVDGDGKEDIVCIDDSGLVRAYTGETRREIWNFQSDDGTSLGRIALADCNGDGNLDAVFTTFSGAVYVLDGNTGSILGIFNTGTYSFTTPNVYDINRDRKSDIIIYAYSGDVFALQMADNKRGIFSFKRSSWKAVNHDTHNTGLSQSSLLFFKKNMWN